MTRDEKLAALTAFAQHVLCEAISEVELMPTRDVCAKAHGLGLIRVRELSRQEAADFGLDPSTEVYDFESWMQPRVDV